MRIVALIVAACLFFLAALLLIFGDKGTHDLVAILGYFGLGSLALGHLLP